MNTRQITTFVRVAQLGRMNKAANELYLSVSAVKKQLDTLEAEMGVPLFDRTASGCTPTEAGRVLLEEATSLISHIEAVKRAAAHALTQEVVACSLTSFPNREQDLLIMKFNAQYPAIKIRHLRRPRSQWLDCLVNGAADYCPCYSGAIVGDPDTPRATWSVLEASEDAYHGLALYRTASRAYPIHCVVSPLSPLAARDSIVLDELVGMPLLADPFTYQFCCLDCIAARADLNVRWQDVCDRRQESLEFCQGGGAIITGFKYSAFLAPLTAVPIRGYEAIGCLLTRQCPTPATRLFVDYLLENSAE